MKLFNPSQSYKKNLLNKDELIKLTQLESEHNRLLKRKEKITHQLKDLNNRIKITEDSHSEFILHLKRNNKNFAPIISVGFDKRWATYNCIVKISGATKSFYLGKEVSIKEKVQQFHKNNIMSRGMNFLKSEIIEIVSTVIMQFIDPKSPKDPFKKRIKLNLDNVLERYVASGEWEYWVSR
jgi:hypothetical protein